MQRRARPKSCTSVTILARIISSSATPRRRERVMMMPVAHPIVSPFSSSNSLPSPVSNGKRTLLPLKLPPPSPVLLNLASHSAYLFIEIFKAESVSIDRAPLIYLSLPPWLAGWPADWARVVGSLRGKKRRKGSFLRRSPSSSSGLKQRLAPFTTSLAPPARRKDERGMN